MRTKKRNPKPPAYIWADCDPDAPSSVRWAFYNTLADQRGNRPDLKPIKLRIVPNDRTQRQPPGEADAATTTPGE